MRMNSKGSAVALAVAAMVASGAAQAQTVNVQVTGKILPQSCTPTLGGGGVVDYGDIPAASINQATYTVLPTKQLSFSISCAAPVRAIVSTVDNRASSRIPDILLDTMLLPDQFNYGLGTHAGANVGGYSLRLARDSFTADAALVQPISSNDQGNSWQISGGEMSHLANMRSSWSTPGIAAPVTFNSLAGTIEVRTAINKGQNLPLQNVVPIDGSASLEVIYI